MARILVIGGAGFYGRKVVEALRRAHEVEVGSRRAAVAVDLGRPETFTAFSGFDLIINCSDSVNAPPDAAIAHVLEHGGVWMEMGADALTIERLLALPVPAAARGAAILGVGVFPGLSTVLARAVVEREPTCARVELGIRFSPLSGAGRGNCALMAKSLFVPAVRRRAGQREQFSSALGPVARLPYGEDQQPRASVVVALPDTALIQRACPDVPDVAAHLSLVPGWLRFSFGLMARFASWLRFARRPLEWLIEWQMILLRAWVLRGVESRLELVAVADRGLPTERSLTLSFADGQAATAAGVAAAVELWAQEPEARVGLFGVGEYFTLEPMLAELERVNQQINAVARGT
jgi:hypothetical protein